MNETGFFKSGDDLGSPAGCRPHPFEEGARITSVAKGAGGDNADRVSAEALGGAMEAAQHPDGIGHGIWREKPGAEHRFTETGDFPIFMERMEATTGETGNFQTDGVGSNIYRNKNGHGGLKHDRGVNGAQMEKFHAAARTGEPAAAAARLAGTGATWVSGFTAKADLAVETA